jgi:hypothetical protein
MTTEQSVPARQDVFPIQTIVGLAQDLLSEEDGITAQWVTITPDLAKSLLQYNTHNRRLNQGRVDEYARQMRAGLWKRTGATIQFARGVLIDGQTRLHALIAAGHTCRFLVVGGLPMAVQNVLDTNGVRSGADALHLDGVPNAFLTAAIIRQWDILERTPVENREAPKRVRLSHQELIDHYRANPELGEVASRLCRWRNLPIGSVWGGVMMHLLLKGAKWDDLDAFFGPISTGVGLANGSPQLALKRRIEEHGRKTRRLTDRELSALIVKAWNAWTTGRSVYNLVWRSDESFPEAI